MATGISWTDETWNPATGCSHVSAGCEHCYAETLSLRRGWSEKPWTAPNAAENVILHPKRLDQPFRWKAPRRIFVNSMSDLFHEQIPDEFIAAVFGVMAARPQHTFQILTKRPERMREWFRTVETWTERSRAVFGDDTSDWRRWHCLVAAAINHIGGGKLSGACSGLTPWPLPNVWLGVSIEQDRWTLRADILRQTPAAVRFISAEPLLEPLPSLNLAGIDWLIFGGESGVAGRWMVEKCVHRIPGYGPSCPVCGGTGWAVMPWAFIEARRLRDLTHAVGGAYFHKQWGGPTANSGHRYLDGRFWDEYPEVHP